MRSAQLYKTQQCGSLRFWHPNVCTWLSHQQSWPAADCRSAGDLVKCPWSTCLHRKVLLNTSYLHRLSVVRLHPGKPEQSSSSSIQSWKAQLQGEDLTETPCPLLTCIMCLPPAVTRHSQTNCQTLWHFKHRWSAKHNTLITVHFWSLFQLEKGRLISKCWSHTQWVQFKSTCPNWEILAVV